jgi:hypothetical protein
MNDRVLVLEVLDNLADETICSFGDFIDCDELVRSFGRHDSNVLNRYERIPRIHECYARSIGYVGKSWVELVRHPETAWAEAFAIMPELGFLGEVNADTIWERLERTGSRPKYTLTDSGRCCTLHA